MNDIIGGDIGMNISNEDKTIKKVTIIGFYNSMATTIFGPMDIFNQAGRLWNRVNNSPGTPFFDVVLASCDGEPVKCTNNIRVMPHCSIETVKKTDLIILASATYIEKILEKSPGLIPWIRCQYDQGAHVASICTGAFLLAETGLLDGKSATLHWGFVDEFRKRYPKIRLDQDRMFIDHGRIYCSAGVNAGMDLSLYLVEKFSGRKAALESARTMILDLGRTRQTPYAGFIFSGKHGDPMVMEVQKKMEGHYTETLDYDQLAGECRMSRRSLERRFRQATGVTPLVYLQHLRIENAKRLLEEGIRNVNEIAWEVGYEDISFFRKVFVRLTGLRPREYQRRFTGYGTGSAPG
ncbi:MAG: helix-turn-helix domain-containing protein [Desulfobacula sp.]|jgi:transcriptional regulator GlxA family with amidase domain